MKRDHDGYNMKDMEYHAKEFVSLTLEVCEERLAFGHTSLTAPQKALAEAAMGVQQSIKTFLAVSKIPDETGSEE